MDSLIAAKGPLFTVTWITDIYVLIDTVSVFHYDGNGNRIKDGRLEKTVKNCLPPEREERVAKRDLEKINGLSHVTKRVIGRNEERGR